MHANVIGPFQFENLVKNRISFALLNFGCDLTGLFQPFYQTYLASMQIDAKSADATKILEEKKISKDGAVVLVCGNGTESEKTAIALEKAGYSNVFVVEGGAEALRAQGPY